MRQLLIILSLCLCFTVISCSSDDSNKDLIITNLQFSMSVVEKQTSAYIIATNSQGDALTYTITGIDSSLLSVSSSGIVTFNTAPNYENPSDADTDNTYLITATVSDGESSDSENLTISVTKECHKPYYLTKPDPIASDSSHRYYEYSWQSDPNICINFRQSEILEDGWEAKITNALTYAKDNLGLIVPLNVFVVDQKKASSGTLQQINVDFCNLFPLGDDWKNSCANNSDEWGNRSPAAGVSHKQLPNGGELFFFRNIWTDDYDQGIPVRILMHEFYHVYQNSMKFYFEDTNRFGIRVQWEDEPGKYLHEQDFVTVFPGWLEEGGADFGGFALATKFDNTIDVRKQIIEHLDEARSVISSSAANGDTVSLKDYEYQAGLYESSNNPNSGITRQFAYAYTGGAMALIYLWSLDNANYKKIMVDYYKNYAEKDNLNPGLGWKNTFEDLFGMTMEKFYQDFDAFMLQGRSSQLAAIKTNEEWRSASFAE